MYNFYYKNTVPFIKYTNIFNGQCKTVEWSYLKIRWILKVFNFPSWEFGYKPNRITVLGQNYFVKGLNYISLKVTLHSTPL